MHRPLVSHLNGELFGQPDAGTDMTFNFDTLIAHVAKTRDLEAGSIVGSGTVSNKEDGGPGRPAAAGGRGYSCIAEQRTVETIIEGKPSTPFMKFGDRVRIEMFDEPAARSSAPSTRWSARVADAVLPALARAASRARIARRLVRFVALRRQFGRQFFRFVAWPLRVTAAPPTIHPDSNGPRA